VNAPTDAGLPLLTDLVARWESALGTRYAAVEHRVEESGLRAYADLFGYTAERFRSAEAARAEGFRGLLAPAGYAAVYTMQAVLVALHAPELGVPFAWNLHAGQSLDFGEPVCAGDVLTTTVTLRGVRPRGANLFYWFETESRTDSGLLTVSGASTQVVRLP
jgi:N-terminal half of MaoC dehydratase